MSDEFIFAYLLIGTLGLHSMELKLRVKYHLGSRRRDTISSLCSYRDLGIKQYFYGCFRIYAAFALHILLIVGIRGFFEGKLCPKVGTTKVYMMGVRMF